MTVTDSKVPDTDGRTPFVELNRTTSITSDAKGNTIITGEDGETFTISEKAERALVWKFDLRVLPLLAMMYLFNSLDKSNLGNAKTAGLEEDLGFAGTNKYNILLSIFFVPYVLTAPFLGILGKMYGPGRVLPCMMFTFGTMTLLVVAVYNWSGLMALRCELARRLAIFYAASSIAYAFGGLLAFGTFQIDGGSIFHWKYLFVIEGSLTMCMAVVAYIFLPRSAATAWFLNDEEKKLAFYRIQIDSSAVVEEKFKLGQAVKIMKHGTSWVILAIEVCLGIPLQSVSLFLPQIVARLGYSTIKTNLYTVAPNISGAVMLLILGYASDLTRWRFPFIALGFLFTFCGMV
ncbi:putative MFS transporter, partial [Hortaea werneckii]